MNKRKGMVAAVLASLCVLAAGTGVAALNFAEASSETGGFTRVTRTYTEQKYGGGSIYASRDGIGVRTVGNIQAVSGAFFLGTAYTCDSPVKITVSGQAVVFDMSVIGCSGSYSLRLGTDKLYGKGVSIYLYDGSTYVKTVQSATNASYGLVTLEADGTYDKVVIPVTAFGLAEGGEYTIEKLSVLARQGYATANYVKYVMHGAYLLDSYEGGAATVDLASATVLYTPSEDSFATYGQNTTNYNPDDYIDARYMTKGDLLFDDAADLANGTDKNDKLYFKIGEGDAVKLLEEYDGFYYTLTNPDEETNYNFLWGLSDGTTDYWSNVTTGAQRISTDGRIANVTARYMHCGMDQAIYYVPFTAFSGGMSELPEETEFTGRLLMQVYSATASSNANASLAESGGIMLGLENVTFVKDGSIREVSASGGVTASRASGLDGTEITFTAEKRVNKATLNGVMLTDAETEALNGGGYTVEISGSKLSLEGGDYAARVNAPENGAASLSSELYCEGEDVVLTVKPDTGYAVDKIFVNGEDRTLEVGQYFKNILILKENADLEISVSFKRATEYVYEIGSVSSLWGCPDGSVFTEFDCVNVQTTKAFTDEDAVEYIGINVPVDSSKAGEYIAIRVSSIAANNRYFYVELVGGETYRRERNATYYYAWADGTAGSLKSFDQTYESEEVKGTRLALAARQCLYENETLNTAINLTSNTQGFNGYMIISLSDFSAAQFDSINIYCATYSKSYSRYNIGEIYGCSLGAAGLPVFGELLWSPAQDYSLYGNTAAVAEVGLLNKGDFVMQNRGNRGDSSYAYDELFFTFPENAIGKDGYVDLAATGIKGIEITVKTERATRLILRVSGAENDGTYLSGEEVKTTTNLLKNDHSGIDLWQTSGSTHPSLVKLDTGLLKTSSSYIMPHYDTYDGYFTIYIEFGDTAFSNWNGKLNFPNKLQPVMLLLGESALEDGETALLNFSSVRFVTSDEEFRASTISLTPQNGVINGKIGNESVMASSNNRVIPGTTVTFNVTPNRGYELKEIWYVEGENVIDIPLTSLREDGTFDIVVNDDINVYSECRAIVYTIEYITDGGEMTGDNPTAYVVTDHKILSDARKSGYQFLGWFDEEGNRVTELKNSIGNLILTARYEKQSSFNPILGIALAVIAVVAAGSVVTAIVAGGRKR